MDTVEPVFNIDHSQATEDKEPNQLGKKIMSYQMPDSIK
jgi:hypothetical protein